MLQYSCLENHSDREAWQATVYRATKSWTRPKWPCMYRHKIFFFCLWQLCPSESWVWRWWNCLACGGPGCTKCAGHGHNSCAPVMALSETFFKTLVAGNEKASFTSLSLYLCPFGHLEGSLAWGPSLLLVHQTHRGGPLAGFLLCRSACQALKETPWVVSYSVVRVHLLLKEHPGWGPTL